MKIHEQSMKFVMGIRIGSRDVQKSPPGHPLGSKIDPRTPGACHRGAACTLGSTLPPGVHPLARALAPVYIHTSVDDRLVCGLDRYVGRVAYPDW